MREIGCGLVWKGRKTALACINPLSPTRSVCDGGASTMDDSTPSTTADFRIARIELDEDTIIWRNADIEQERRVAIFDLIEENSFKPLRAVERGAASSDEGLAAITSCIASLRITPLPGSTTLLVLSCLICTGRQGAGLQAS